MPDFRELLKTKAADIKPPEALPVGTYLCLVDGQAELTTKGKNNNGCAIFKLKFMQPQGDVDQTQLVTILNGKALSEKFIRHTLWITDDSLWRLDNFLANDLGIDKGDKDTGQMIPEAPGRQVMVTIGHRPSDDGKQIYMEIKSTAHI